MTVINNATLILKDKQGNEGIVKSFTNNDINKISNAITDVGQVVDPATHMPIEATKTSAGVVQLATAQDITNGTAGKVVDAQELNNFAQTLPAANGVTDVSSGDNSNQLVVSRIGGSKTLTIDNVEHASNADEATHATQADTATSANSVAWDNVQDKPSSFTPASHTHDDRYYTESEIDTKLSFKVNRIDSGYKSIAGNGKYYWCKLATITINVNYVNDPISFEIDGRGILRSIVQIMFESADNSDPPLTSFTSDISTEFYIKKVATSKWELYGKYSEPWGSFFLYRVSCNTDGIAIDITPSNLSSEPSGTTRASPAPAGSVAWGNVSGRPTAVSQFTNDSGYITGITKAMVTNALGYTPPTTNTTYNFAGTTFYSGNSDNAEHDANNAVKNGNYYYYSNGPATSLGASTNDGALYVQSYSDSWVAQIAQDYRNGRLFVRGKKDNTWQAWNAVIDSANIGSQSVNYANSSGNADTLDGSHAWQMQTLAANGSIHGSGAWLLQCQHNVDGDSYFKLYCGDKSVGTKVDRASTAGWADSAGSVAWGNVSGRPDIWIG